MKNIFLLISFIIIVNSDINAQITGNSIYDNARRNYLTGNFTEAIKYYNDYLKSHPNNDVAYHERGMCFESLRKFDEALKDYSTAISLKPFYPVYYESRGYAYLKLNLPQNSLDDFTKSILNNPLSAEGYWGRTNAYLDLEKYGSALTDINAAININPDNFLYYYARAVIYTELNDTANFFNDLDIIVNKYSSDFFSSYKSQVVVLILDNISTNIYNLTKQLSENPENSFIYFRRGFNFYLLRKFDLAIEDFTNAVKYTSDQNSRLISLSKKLVENCGVYSDR